MGKHRGRGDPSSQASAAVAAAPMRLHPAGPSSLRILLLLLLALLALLFNLLQLDGGRAHLPHGFIGAAQVLSERTGVKQSGLVVVVVAVVVFAIASTILAAAAATTLAAVLSLQQVTLTAGARAAAVAVAVGRVVSVALFLKERKRRGDAFFYSQAKPVQQGGW